MLQKDMKDIRNWLSTMCFSIGICLQQISHKKKSIKRRHNAENIKVTNYIYK